MSNIEELSKQADEIIKGLEQYKQDLYVDLKDIYIKVDSEFDHTIRKSLTVIFGEDSGVLKDGVITFDMYLQCLKIIRNAGVAKGIKQVKA